MTQNNFSLAKATAGHCGIGATMNILNYFWKTNFGLKDTKNIEIMIRNGKYHENHRPSEFEILLFLANNHFRIDYFSLAEKGNFEFLATDPEGHKEKWGYEYYPFMDVSTHLNAIKSLYKHKNFIIAEGENQNFEEIIRTFSDKNHCFLFTLDYFLIHNFANPDNFPGGHIMMSTGFIENTHKIRLFESTPNTPDVLFQNNPDFVDKTFLELYNAGLGDLFIISQL